MSYKIKMRDNSELIVPDEAGKALEEHWLGLTKPEPIEIAGDAYMSSEIRSITKTNLSSGPSTYQQLAAPKYNCVQAGTSIQKEIHRRALLNKTEWTKLVRDKAWREKTRKEIRAEDPERKWCDHIVDEHVCLEVQND